MAISKVTTTGNNGGVGWATILAPTTAGTISVQAGDLVVVSVTVDPGNTTGVTVAKNAGTAAIGTVSAFTSQTGTNAATKVCWFSVTTTGTLQIKVTNTGSPNSGVVAVVAYRGASGVGQTTIGTGSTGTDITLSLTTVYANSWCVIAATSEGHVTALTGGTGTTLEVAGQINVVGTVDDMSAGIGSNEAALSAGTNQALHLTQPTGKVWSAVMLELVQQFTKTTPAASVAASATKIGSSVKSVTETVNAAATEKVMTNLKSVSESVSAAATKVASSVKSVGESVSASATEKASSVKAASVHVTGLSSEVASSVKAAAAHVAGLAAEVASSVKGASVHLTALASELASSAKTLNESVSVSSSERVLTNLKAVSALLTAVATEITQSVEGSSSHSGASATVVASSVMHPASGIGVSVTVVPGGGPTPPAGPTPWPMFGRWLGRRDVERAKRRRIEADMKRRRRRMEEESMVISVGP